MSASTLQGSATLGNYSFAHNNPPTLQHNRDVSFGSSPPTMGSQECPLRMSVVNDYGLSASTQHIATMSDMNTVVPTMENFNVIPWTSGSPSSGDAILPGSPHILPNPCYDLGDARFRSASPSHPGIGGAYWSPHAFQMLGLIGHTSPVSLQRSMTASCTHSVVPMMANSNSVSFWEPDNHKTGASDDRSHCRSYLHDVGGASSGVLSHTSMERVYLPPHAFPMPGPIGHTSLVSSQCGMTASNTHSVVSMMANPNAVSWTPCNISHGTSQSVPPPVQSELTTNQPSLYLCRWVYNNAPCGYDGTLEDLKQHWYHNHLPKCPGVSIPCQWEHCNYHKRGHPSNNKMVRCSVWRHISEVHLKRRRN
ncbi:uncharacterized protein EDB93DRAFT_893227 [Suillus bovinus]|uniref:uncharacterized protein n=1 Tax=Suillus bovinus TaxID=48563 RepID=UPI001B8866B0|nr:uncharacterized protein EDB93DRAFT_893227 [Suillus bovinus]KAG2132829.1 hypothetical protein EDB93DRAFT_893227 [Suillus bovinus]